MILEAFSEELKARGNRGRAPERVLFDWLSRTLLVPPAPGDMVGRVIHTEIEMFHWNGYPTFEGKSDTGRKLLESLYQYCRSYDHWKFTQWLHVLNASDFSQSPDGSPYSEP